MKMHMTVGEAIAVFDKSAERTAANTQTAAWEVLSAHLAAASRLADVAGFILSDMRTVAPKYRAQQSIDELSAALSAFHQEPTK